MLQIIDCCPISIWMNLTWKPRKCIVYLWSFLKRELEDINTFCGNTDTTVLNFWWRLSWFSKAGWVSSRACFIACVQWIFQNHLLCDTCWPLGDQCGSRTAFDPHTCTRIHVTLECIIMPLYVADGDLLKLKHKKKTEYNRINKSLTMRT